MKEITIAQIREKANDIETLNQGHLLYKNKEYSNYKYKFAKYQGIVLEGEANFAEFKTSLSVGDKIRSSCSCENGFCKHKVALYFLLKDTLTEILKGNIDVSLIATYDINAIMETFIDEVKQNFNKYQIIPIVSLNKDSINLKLQLFIQDKTYIINDIYNFVNTYMHDQKYSYGTLTINNFKKYYSSEATKLLNILALFEQKNNVYPISLFEEIYYIYKNLYIYLTDDVYEKIYFSNEHLPIKLEYENRNVILREHLNIYKSLTKTFVFLNNKFYVLDNENDSKLISLINFQTDDNILFSFDENNENLFYSIIYDGLEDYFDLDLTKVLKFKINSYIDYKNASLIVNHRIYDNNDKEIKFSLSPLKLVNYENYLTGLGFIADESDYFTNNKEKIADFILTNVNKLRDFGNVYFLESCNKIQKFKGFKVNYRLNLDSSFFDLVFQDLSYSKEELNAIFKGYELKEKYVMDSNGNLILLDEDGYNIYKMFKELNLDPLNLKEDNKLPFYELYKLNAFRNLLNNASEFDKFIDDFNNYSNEEKLSTNLKGILRDYQIKGFNWLSVLYKYGLGGILADDMGLGKTIEIIALIDTIKNEKPILIVCPTSLVFNWESEFQRFLPNRKPKIINGSALERANQINDIKNTDIIIASYESVRIDIEKFANINYELLIADEAQYLKNPQAYKTIAMKKLNSRAIFALSGTPIENNILDLWSIFDFILPGFLSTKKDFLSLYSNSKMDLISLSKQIAPFILRREKQRVLFLPPKIENNVYAYLEGKQLTCYEAYLANVQQKLKEENYAIPYVLKTLIELREFMCEPRLFINNYEGENAKLNTLMEIVNESVNDNHRILIFSSFPSVFKYIIPKLEASGITYDVLDGKTPKDERVSKVNDFNQSDKTKVFLISLKVGGSGLNLPGADMVIHYDPWWNIAATNQATDRAYRFGQTKEVHVIKLIVKNTIEEKILALQQKKAKLSEDVISDSGFIKELSKEEIIDLFGGLKWDI